VCSWYYWFFLKAQTEACPLEAVCYVANLNYKEDQCDDYNETERKTKEYIGYT
jgi:hypothetical protein